MFLAVIQTDSYCSIQQTKQLYRQGKGVSIGDDGGRGCLQYASVRIFLLLMTTVQVYSKINFVSHHKTYLIFDQPSNYRQIRQITRPSRIHCILPKEYSSKILF